MAAYRDTRCACFWDYLLPFTRFWGIFTSVVLCGVGADVTFHHHVMGIYVIVASVIVFFLEITWAITLFLNVCLRNEYSPALRCWDGVLWVDSWKKSVLYAAFSVPLFVRPHRLWLSSVAGVMLVLLAFLYLTLLCAGRMEVKETLLQDREESFDRFDDIPETMDDALANSGRDSLEDQDVILEM